MSCPAEIGRVRAYAAKPPLPVRSQWAHIEPLLPPPAETGQPEAHSRRNIITAMVYVARAGGSWQQLPADYPPWQTVCRHFACWGKQGVTHAVHDALRIADGRQVEPTAGIVDAQSVKGAGTVGRPSRGYDNGKKINGGSSLWTPLACRWRSWSPRPASTTPSAAAGCSATTTPTP